MTDDELPEDLAPHERHWALGADFIGATLVLILCAGTIAWLATR